MVDISKHPLYKQIYELCQAIEVCGASPQLTNAVSLASDLYKSVDALLDAETSFKASGVTVLSDGSAVFTASLPLPKDHWIYAEDGELSRVINPILTHELRPYIVEAVRRAVRGATMNGVEKDFDPDALVQNTVIALCGGYGKL